MNELPPANEQPPGLSQSDTHRVAAALGTSEMKAIMVGAMKPGEPYTSKMLYQEVMDLQGAPPVWDSKRLPYSLCGPLVSAGLLTRTTTDDGALAHMLTPGLGEKFGLPFVGHALDISLMHEPPLVGLLGAPQPSKGKYASENHTTLLQYLSDCNGDEQTIAEVAAAIDMKVSRICVIAGGLAGYQVLQYESSGRGQPTVRFMATAALYGAQVIHPTTTGLLAGVVALLREHFTANPDAPLANEDIARRLQDSSDTYAQLPPRFNQRVAGRTTYLAEIGVLTSKRQIENTDKKARGRISATSGQLDTINAVLAAVKGLHRPTSDYIDEGLEKLQIIKSEPSFIRHLVEKAKSSSLGIKGHKEAMNDTRARITAFFDTAGKSLSSREVTTYLAAQGVHLMAQGVAGHLERLVAAGQLLRADSTQVRKYMRASCTDTGSAPLL